MRLSDPGDLMVWVANAHGSGFLSVKVNGVRARQDSVTGGASDAQGVSEVRIQINGMEWRSAIAGPTGWNRWTAPVSLQAGSNTLRAYSVDIAGNRSPTKMVTFTYVVSGPLLVGTNGVGMRSPNLNGQRLAGRTWAPDGSAAWMSPGFRAVPGGDRRLRGR